MSYAYSAPVQFIRRLLSLHLPILVSICFILYLFTAGGHFSSTDEEDIYINTEILSQQYSRMLFGRNYPVGGEYSEQRAPQEIGQSLAALPWYWAGVVISEAFHPQWKEYIRRAIMTTFNLFVTLMTLWVLYLWMSQVFTPSVATLTVALYGLGTLAWPYSQTFYREPLVGLCLLLSFWYAARFRESSQRSDFLVSSAAIILAVATKFVVVIAIPLWLVSVVHPRLLKRAGFRHYLLMTIAIFGVMSVAIFTLSAKQETLLHYIQEVVFDIKHNRSVFFSYGLYGLTLSTGKGLLIYAPPVLLSLLGFPKFLRLYRQDALVIGGIFLLFLVVYSTRRGWHGGACWGPRYLLPILPLLMLPAGSFLSSHAKQIQDEKWFSTRLAQMTIVGVFMSGVVVQLAAVSVFPLNYYFLKAQEGTLSLESWDGGPAYLHEIFFDPTYTPVIGHIELAVQRIRDVVKYGSVERQGVFPADAYDLWLYMITLERLDYWWLQWWMQPPSSVTPDSDIGVVTAPIDADWLAVARHGGIQWDRWQLNWRDVEPLPGVYDFTITDKELAALRAGGLDVSALLTYPPDWARRPGTFVPVGLEDIEHLEQSEWYKFVYTVVKRYPDIQYWEIWNEPDLEIFWGGTVEDYFHLLRSGYLAVKRANPDAQVIMGGLAYWSDPAFFEQILDLIMADPEALSHSHYFDISAWHWYGRANDLYDKVVWAREVMADRSLEKPIWVNEMNVELTPALVQGNEKIQWTASSQEQAAFIVQGYSNAKAAGAEKVFVFRLDDANMASQWGLVENDKKPRAAYTALQSVAEFLNGATAYARTRSDGITHVIFNKGDGQEIWVVWNERPTTQQLVIPTSLSSLRVGLPDRRIQVVAARDGVIKLTLPPATANHGNNEDDHFIGGMPLFLFFDTESSPAQVER